MLVLVQGSLLECVFTIVGFITTACIVFLCKSKKKSKRRSAAGMVRLLPGQFHEESKYEYSTQPQDPMITALQFEDEKKPPPVLAETGRTELNVDVTEAGGETGFATAFGQDAVNKDVQRSEVKSSATNVQKTEKSAVVKSLNKSKFGFIQGRKSKPSKIRYVFFIR
ncbi:hypothetical protein COOONC_07093 [Cooperia oncophora]